MTAVSDDDFHLHASTGDLAGLRALIATYTGALPVNSPDANGFTAMFHAQMNGHDDVAQVLENHGWTRMSSGLIFKGPGGRSMFWSWCTAAPGPVAAKPTNKPSFFLHKHPKPEDRVDTANARRSADAARRKAAALRTMGRASRYHSISGWNTVGPDHKLYLRKSEGGAAATQRRSKKPGLNTADVPELYSSPTPILAAAAEAEAPSWSIARPRLLRAEGLGRSVQEDTVCGEDENDAHTAQWGVEAACPGSLTVAAVARFVVPRKARRTADGGWELVPAAEADEPAALFRPLDEDIQSLDSFGNWDEQDEAPAARASPMEEVTAPELDLEDQVAWPALMTSPASTLLRRERLELMGEAGVAADRWEILSTASADSFDMLPDLNEPDATGQVAAAVAQPAAARAWADVAKPTAARAWADAMPTGAVVTAVKVPSAPAPSPVIEDGSPEAFSFEPLDLDAMKKDLDGQRWGLRQGGRGSSLMVTERRDKAIAKRREQSANAKVH